MVWKNLVLCKCENHITCSTTIPAHASKTTLCLAAACNFWTNLQHPLLSGAGRNIASQCAKPFANTHVFNMSQTISFSKLFFACLTRRPSPWLPPIIYCMLNDRVRADSGPASGWAKSGLRKLWKCDMFSSIISETIQGALFGGACHSGMCAKLKHNSADSMSGVVACMSCVIVIIPAYAFKKK